MYELHMRQFVATFLLCACACGGVAAQAEEDMLRDDLMASYNKHSLPDTFTNVSVRFVILDIDIDTRLSAMMLETWPATYWKDPRLQWDPARYSDIKKLRFDSDSVWLPDLYLYNSGDLSKADLRTSTQVVVSADGSMLQVPTAMYPATCTLDMKYWPHDVHNCTLKLGSWAFDANQVDLYPLDVDPQVEFEMEARSAAGNVVSRHSWEVLSTNLTRNEKTYDCCPEAYVDLSLTLVVRRDAPGLPWTVKIPVMVLSLMTGLPLMIPAGDSNRIVVGSLVLIMDLIFLAYTSGVVSASPAQPPILVKLVSGELVLTLVLVITGAILTRLVSTPHSRGLPACLRRPLSVLSYCFCLSGYRKLSVESAYPESFPKSMKGEEITIGDGVTAATPWLATPGNPPHSRLADWLLLAAVIDRLILILYVAQLVATIFSYSGFF